MSGRLAAALGEAFDPVKHPRARGGKFADVLAGGHVVPKGAFGPMSRSSFGGNLHRITLEAGGGSQYSFDRRPSGIWHHTFTSGMGGTSFVSPSVPLSPEESKKLDTIDLAAAKKDIADTKDPARRASLEAHVKGGYFTGPSALAGSKEKAFRDYTTGRTKTLPDGSDPLGARQQPQQHPLHDAFHDKVGGRTYIGQDGNYHMRLSGGKTGGPVAPWNDAVKAQFGTDQIAFHKAANDYIRPVTLPSSDPVGDVIPEGPKRVGQAHLFQTWPYLDAANEGRSDSAPTVRAVEKPRARRPSASYFVQPASDWRQPQRGRDPRWGMGVG